jgi:hypothetical protein
MSLSVQCPTCSNELLAADELVGKLASCPHCQTQFPITMSPARIVETPGTVPRHSEAASPSVALGSIPDAKPLNLRTAPSMLRPTADASTPPTSVGETDSDNTPGETTQATNPIEPPASRAQPDQHAASLYPPGQVPAASESETHAAKSSTGTNQPAPVSSQLLPASSPRPDAKSATKKNSRSSSGPAREARPARFIAAESSETRVELGHDGQLPVLKLEEATHIDVDDRNTRDSNPWLLVAALAFSFGMSAVLLFVDTSGTPAEQTTKTSARGDIEMYYSRPVAKPNRYRKLLREALQAYNKEDYATERKRYKLVLDLLHAENNDPYSGLTGQVSASQPPNDRHLEELLSTLVDN